jgi:hypothetical protein
MAQSERPCPLGNLLRLLAGALSQGVIDGCDLDRRIASARPACREQHESDRIWSAGNRQEQLFCLAERREKRLGVEVT